MVELKGRKRKAQSSHAAAQPQAQRRSVGKVTSTEAADDTSPEQAQPEQSEATSSESYESTGDEGSEEEEDTSDEEESDADGDGGDEQVETMFNFQEPKEDHFHGLRNLLQNYLDGQEFDVSGLVDLILKQAGVGTVVIGEDWSYCYGVLSAFRVRKHTDSAALTAIHAFILQHCPDSLRSKFAEAWKGKGTELLVSERVLNCPPKVSPPLFAMLEEELDAERSPAPAKDLLLLSRVFRDDSAGEKASYVYTRPEDQFFHKAASWSFLFPVAGRVVRKGELQPLRLVMLLTRTQYTAARAELDAAIGNDLPPLDA